MSAIDMYSSELKPTTEHQAREQQKPMTWTKMLGNITTPLFFTPAKRRHHEHYKKFAEEKCQRLHKGTDTLSEAV
jgi:hypothetical protein